MKRPRYSAPIKSIFALAMVALLLGSAVPTLAQGPSISFAADRRLIQAGQCVNIRWNVTDVKEVHYNGAPVAGENQVRNECPGQTRTFYLEVLQHNGQVVTLPLTIYVQGGQPVPVIRFWADRTTIRRGECVNISWHVQNVKEVYYKRRGVVGENQGRRECPKKTRIYDLIVIRPDGHPVLSTITINVIP